MEKVVHLFEIFKTIFYFNFSSLEGPFRSSRHLNEFEYNLNPFEIYV
jgi:hypothetical protein